jgi:hypothetical protein
MIRGGGSQVMACCDRAPWPPPLSGLRRAATSVHLVCRPDRDKIGDWHALRELHVLVIGWALQQEGPGARSSLCVHWPRVGDFQSVSRSRCRGTEIRLGDPEATNHTNAAFGVCLGVVGRTALEQVLGTAEGRAGTRGRSVGEDARLTAFSSGLFKVQTDADERGRRGTRKILRRRMKKASEERGLASAVFDVVRRFAQPLASTCQNGKGGSSNDEGCRPTPPDR